VRAQDPPGSHLKVYLMTMGTGGEIYERFGHNAIWIRDTAAGTDRIYNFGTFEVEPTFTGIILFGAKFAMGPQRYWLGVDTSLDHTIAVYRYFKRDVVAQELNLSPTQRTDLASRLAINAREENKYYWYDYFRDNCSTRVRDILDVELGGALKQATTGKPAAGTLRFHTRRSITNNIPLFIGIDAAFGPNVDKPLDQWDEMFLPEKVQQRVRELKVAGADGTPQPLVAKEFPLLTLGIFRVEPKPPQWGGPLFVTGLLVAGLVRLAAGRGALAKVGRVVGGAWMLLMGIGGVILLFFWIFTQHVATWANHNLLLMSPLALALVPAFWHRAGRTPPRWTPVVAIVVMASVAVGAVLAIPGVGGQRSELVGALVILPTFLAALEGLRASNRGLRPKA